MDCGDGDQHDQNQSNVAPIQNNRVDLDKGTASRVVYSLVGDKYRLIKKMDSGAAAEIYAGVSLDGKEDVVIKGEHQDTVHPLLPHEYRVYKILQEEGAVDLERFIPEVQWYGPWEDYTGLVTERLGPSLQTVFNRREKRFSLKTVLELADQMIDRLHWLHSKGFFHGDVKPSNFLMGQKEQDKGKIFIIDFGLSKRYWNAKKGEHAPFGFDKNPFGTPCFCSRHSIRGYAQSRRDDLESLGYTFMYFLRGDLPWIGMEGETRTERLKKGAEVKLTTLVEDLCEGHPEEFVTYLEYCRNLHFKEMPDYGYLKQLFQDLYLKKFGRAIPDSPLDLIDSDDLVPGSQGCTKEGFPTEEIESIEEETSRPFYLNSKSKKRKDISSRKEIQCGLTVWKVEKPKTKLQRATYKWKLEHPEVQDYCFGPEVTELIDRPEVQFKHVEHPYAKSKVESDTSKTKSKFRRNGISDRIKRLQHPSNTISKK